MKIVGERETQKATTTTKKGTKTENSKGGQKL